MSTTLAALGNYARMQGPAALCIGESAGSSRDATATGGAYVGYQAGISSSTGGSSFAIGASANVGTDTGRSIAIGYLAQAISTDPAAASIALGVSAYSTRGNEIVIGPQIGTVEYPQASWGATMQEFGGMHQYFWTRTTASGNLNLTGSTGAMSILNGWIAFETISANATMTLPSLSDMLGVFPTMVQGSSGELVVSNFNAGGYTVSVVNNTDSYWYNTTAMPANTIQHVYWRNVYDAGFQQATPFIEFFS
jgi:hypothetical protein